MLLRLGQRVDLPPKAIGVLLALVRQPGATVTKQSLMDAVWPDAFVEEANLNQMVFLLRRALADGISGKGYIMTVPRRGYRFAAPVRAIEVPLHIDSIAVLPLVNVSADSAQEYFADGMTEALIASLGKLGRLRVVSRTSVMRYKGVREPLAQIARALRVDAVLEGSVAQFGDSFRITVLNAYGIRQVPFEGVAREVAAQLRVKMTPREEVHLSTSRPVNPDANQLYFKVRYCARVLTGDSQRKAIQYFRQSIDIDPDYALPYAGIAESFVALAYYFGMVPKQAFSEAKPNAIRAVNLDDTLAEGHAVLGLLQLLDDWDWVSADAETQRAVELAPGDSYVHWKRGIFLQYAARATFFEVAKSLIESHQVLLVPRCYRHGKGSRRRRSLPLGEKRQICEGVGSEMPGPRFSTPPGIRQAPLIRASQHSNRGTCCLATFIRRMFWSIRTRRRRCTGDTCTQWLRKQDPD